MIFYQYKNKHISFDF